MAYLDNVRSIKSIILACIFYDGITSDLVKRREVYKHFKKRDDSNIQNNIEPYLQNNKNASAESKKESFNINNKKVVTDFDEFFYDDEQFEIQHKINKERNEKTKESFNNISTNVTRRSHRNPNASYNSLNNLYNTRELKPKVLF